MLKNKVVLALFSIAVLLQEPSAPAQTFTVQVGNAPPTPTPLVNHGDVWKWRKGTNEPVATWQTDADGSLDSSWSTGTGGFGYGDTNIVGEGTTLSDMINQYTTIYIRKSFNVASGVDTNSHLQLVVDYDDGFVAYLDGAELKRANLTNGIGTFVRF